MDKRAKGICEIVKDVFEKKIHTPKFGTTFSLILYYCIDIYILF